MAKAKWTVMVLMGADNLENEADLTGCAVDDIKEMRTVGSVEGELNIVVQIHEKENGGPRKFLVTKEGNLEKHVPLGPGEESSGDPDVLERFLAWAKGEYPANRYMLVIWGHAWRFAFLRDGSSALDFTKLSGALESTNDGDPVHIVAFDSCGVSWIEVAYQLRDVAQYLVATQYTDPLPGWPYDEILERVAAEPDMGADDLSRAIVSQFVRHYNDKPVARYSDRAINPQRNKSATVTMTAVNLLRADKIRDLVGQLAIALAISVKDDDDELSTVQDAFERSQVPNSEAAADLTTLCWHLMNYSASGNVRIAAAALGDLLLRPVDAFIIAHEKSDLTVAMLNGVSIFAPNLVKPGFDPQTVRQLYDALDLSQDTIWSHLVYALAYPDA